MKLQSMVFLSLFALNGCAYYSHQFGFGDMEKFCPNSNLENVKNQNTDKYFISDTQFFYVTKNGDYYSEKEFNQLTSPTFINVAYGNLSAKELADTSKKVFFVKFTNVNSNKNLCSPTLVSNDEFESTYSESIIGRKVIITPKGENIGISGKEVYRDERKGSISLEYL
ncbi:hypothetical protein AB6G46_24010 [Providencia hangzhouensis]|uniref:hypothetical protein n=1 Tax=Providencia TaxID=586 RepID=UPI00234ADBAF|nr:hypothetical protein [Providencia sp. PROV089]